MYPELLSPESQRQFEIHNKHPMRMLTGSESLVREILSFDTSYDSMTPSLVSVKRDILQSRVDLLDQKSLCIELSRILNRANDSKEIAIRLKRIYPFVALYDELCLPLGGDLIAMKSGMPVHQFIDVKRYCTSLVLLVESLYTPPQAQRPYMVQTGLDSVYARFNVMNEHLPFHRLTIPGADQVRVLEFFDYTGITPPDLDVLTKYQIHPQVQVVSMYERRFLQVRSTAGHAYLFLPRLIWELSQVAS